MAAPPYVSMNPSVTSDRGQPTPSPLRIGALTPEVFLMSHRSWLNPAQVVGTFRLWLVKNEELYQKPGLTLPVYAPPQTLPVTLSGASAPRRKLDGVNVPVESATQPPPANRFVS